MTSSLSSTSFSTPNCHSLRTCSKSVVDFTAKFRPPGSIYSSKWLSCISWSPSLPTDLVRCCRAATMNDHNLEGEEPKIKEEERLGSTRSREKRRALRIGLVCGGPSAERGISLNSARSVLDHIQGDDVIVSCYYIDPELNAYAIPSAQVYSNTPADFDFKLEGFAQGFSSLSDFTLHLAASIDIVFPVIHGRFGEDGGLQELLERAHIPFVGTKSAECRKAFDKYEASIELDKLGFSTIPSQLLQKSQCGEKDLQQWFIENQLDPSTGKVVVKPARAGSSIGVSVAYGIADSWKKAKQIFAEEIDDRVLVELFLEGGRELTAIVLDVGTVLDSYPVTLLPSEVEIQFSGSNDGQERDAIFNYRRKYLPTQQVAYYTPPRFPTDVIGSIREGASLLFQQLGLVDFARIDGWYLPYPDHTPSFSRKKFGTTDSGIVLFSDINLISGMEQTSFLFQQASKVGFSHANILRSIIQHACSRLSSLSQSNSSDKSSECSDRGDSVSLMKESCRKVFVIFGGDSSERQVSLISGTNVWLNLQEFDDLEVVPCLLAPEGSPGTKMDNQDLDLNSRSVWSLPYSLVLRHTVEEVLAACVEAIEPAQAALTTSLRKRVTDDLATGLSKHKWFNGFDIPDEQPVKYSMLEFIKLAKEVGATVFLAVHGGIGEDGTLQSLLEAEGVPYTGPGVASSKVCMDKVATSLALEHLAEFGVHTIDKEVRKKTDLLRMPAAEHWQKLISKLQCQSLCVKPARDGCSTGVARLCAEEDLAIYIQALKDSCTQIYPNSFSKSHGMIEMPNPPPELFIFEPFIETDQIKVSSKSVNPNGFTWEGRSRWMEITVGVIGKRGSMRSLTPSVTVRESGDILSLEEKFQGGTGINLTPPPASFMSDEAVGKCKQRIELIANTLHLEGFSRIDAFVNVDSGEVLVIEVNTVPGMTPSTVLIQQALAEEPPMYPRQFFRYVLDLASGFPK